MKRDPIPMLIRVWALLALLPLFRFGWWWPLGVCAVSFGLAWLVFEGGPFLRDEIEIWRIKREMR